MRIILTGATGFIGQEVLQQCIKHSSITSIVVLSRRALPESTSPKVKVILVDDFLNYTPEHVSQTEGAQACIWALGKAYMPDMEEAKRVSTDYPLAAAHAFVGQYLPKDLGDGQKLKFRFVYLSGNAAERDQDKPLWMLDKYLKIRGQAENEILEFADRNQNSFEAYVLRPKFVLHKEFNFLDLFKKAFGSVKVDVLAASMIEIALGGFRCDTLQNADIINLARDGSDHRSTGRDYAGVV